MTASTASTAARAVARPGREARALALAERRQRLRAEIGRGRHELIEATESWRHPFSEQGVGRRALRGAILAIPIGIVLLLVLRRRARRGGEPVVRASTVAKTAGAAAAVAVPIKLVQVLQVALTVARLMRPYLAARAAPAALPAPR